MMVDIDKLGTDQLIFYACLALGAVYKPHPTSKMWMNGTLVWPSGREIDPLDPDVKFEFETDPDFGFHLKLRNQRFVVDIGNGPLETRERYRIDWIDDMRGWETSIGDIKTYGNLRDSVLRAIITNKVGNPIKVKPWMST